MVKAMPTSFSLEHSHSTTPSEILSETGSIVSGAKKLQHGGVTRLAALDRYWSERTALISSHHHRELAAAQSAVHQVITQQSKMGETAKRERLARFRAAKRIEELSMEVATLQQANAALWHNMGQVHQTNEAITHRLAEAEAEKAAVMAAGEVLLAELEELGEIRDDAVHRLAEEEEALKEVRHALAVMQADKADALASATAAAGAKSEALARLAVTDGVRKAVQRQLSNLQEMAPPELAARIVQEESAAATDAEAAADVALHQSITQRSSEVSSQARSDAAALANFAQELRKAENARLEAERGQQADRTARESLQQQCTTLQKEVEVLRQESSQAQESCRLAEHQQEALTAELAAARDNQSAASREAEQVQPLRQRLAAAEAAAEAANKRADQEAEFRVDVAQGLNEELAARDRALRRAALDRTTREAALLTAQRDLEDAELATQEAQHLHTVERKQWEDRVRRARSQEESLHKKLKAATLECRNANRAGELTAVMQQVAIQKLEGKLRHALDSLMQEQLSSEKSRQRDALEIHRLEEQIKGMTQSAVSEAAEAASVLARAEAERRRISDKYTWQQKKAHEMIDNFQQSMSKAQAECRALAAENTQLRALTGTSSTVIRQPGNTFTPSSEQSTIKTIQLGEAPLSSSVAPSLPSSEDTGSTCSSRRRFTPGRSYIKTLGGSASEQMLSQPHSGSPDGSSSSSRHVRSASVEAQLELLQAGRAHSKRSEQRWSDSGKLVCVSAGFSVTDIVHQQQLALAKTFSGLQISASSHSEPVCS